MPVPANVDLRQRVVRYHLRPRDRLMSEAGSVSMRYHLAPNLERYATDSVGNTCWRVSYRAHSQATSALQRVIRCQPSDPRESNKEALPRLIAGYSIECSVCYL